MRKFSRSFTSRRSAAAEGSVEQRSQEEESDKAWQRQAALQ